MNHAGGAVGVHIGRRIRELRSWRNLNQKELADLAGFSKSYLSMIENGSRLVDKRSTLEAFAHALRVSPTELTHQPWETGADNSETHAGLVAMESALDDFELGEDPGGPVREWPEIVADVKRVIDLNFVQADYSTQSDLAPRLLRELHAVYVRQPEIRRDALIGLIYGYRSAFQVAKRLGSRGLPMLAARLVQQCADEHGAPQWRGYAAFLRGSAAGHLSRPRHYQRVVSRADELRPSLDDHEVLQIFGMLNLSAALACAAQNDRDTAAIHLNEAEAVAKRMDAEVGTFARLWFGRANVGMWRTMLAAELGAGPKVAEIARGVNAEAIPSPARRAEFYCDVGRCLLPRRRTRDEGMALLLRAERLAPQRVHNDVFVREVVAEQIRAARRDTLGRELRGLAYRMGMSTRAPR